MYKEIQVAQTYFRLRGYKAITINSQTISKKKLLFLTGRKANSGLVQLLFLGLKGKKMSFNTAETKEWIKNNGQYKHLICVCNKLSIHSKKILDANEIYFETMRMEDLSWNKMEHIKVPKYTIATVMEDLPKLNKLAGKQPLKRILPLLDSTDTVCRIMGFKRGTILKVESSCNIEGFSTEYFYVE